MEILIHGVIIGLVVLCIHYTYQDGEIFGWFGNWFSHHLPEKIHQPVFECNVCMTPWYGSAVYWITPWERIGLHERYWLVWAFVILIGMGLNIIINKWTHPDKT